MKYLISVVVLMCTFIGGAEFGWRMHEKEYAQERQAIIDNFESEGAAVGRFKGHFFAGLSNAVDEKKFALFDQAVCTMIKEELSALSSVSEEFLQGAGIKERLEKAKFRLSELERANRCDSEI